MSKLVSIIIVNWNGRKWLQGCLDSIQNQRYKHFEVIFVDNSSTDDSIEYVRKTFPDVLILPQTENLGFAAGNNAALKAARGELLLLLNNDILAPPDFLEKFVNEFESIPRIGAAQSKMVQMHEPDKLDSCGSYWTASTFLFHYGNGKPQQEPAYNRPFPVFTNKGASMLIRRDLVDQIGLFDDDFWCYYEETDFCHRVWLSGYECWYLPSAVMSHAGGGTSLSIENSYIQFHNFKNKLLSFLKNFQLKSFLSVLPPYLAIGIGLSMMWLIQGKYRLSTIFIRSIFWNIRHFRKTLHKRAEIQSLRKLTDQELLVKTSRSPKFRYYQDLFNGRISQYED